MQHAIGRRVFLCSGGLILSGAMADAAIDRASGQTNTMAAVRIGLVTDLHYADMPSAGTRHYRDTLKKLGEAAKRFEEEKVDFVVSLGDMIDSADSLNVEKGYLQRVVKEFEAAPGRRHYVLGNHCVSALTKPEFLEIVDQEASYYSFDVRGFHFIVLDACFRSDGSPYGRKNFDWKDANIPAAELEWLRADLSQTKQTTVVFVHQRLDVEPPLGVKNAGDIRKILEDSGRVRAVLQGHDHKGGHKQIARIDYVTLSAMVEGPAPTSNAYAVVAVQPDGVIQLTGLGKQKSIELHR